MRISSESFRRLSLRPRHSRKQGPQLPEDVLLIIFEIILDSNLSSAAYRALLSASLVCGDWNRAASRVILSYPEIYAESHGQALVATLKRTSGSPPTMKLAVLVSGTPFTDAPPPRIDPLTSATFDDILALTPNLRDIVIFHADFPGRAAMPSLHPNLSHLSHLVDVTFATISTAQVHIMDRTLLAALPSSVRFLNIPYLPQHTHGDTPPPPSFSLYGLTTPEYPSPVVEWLLSNSHQTLQCLTVRGLTDFPLLSANHPNLRSLRVLGRTPDSTLHISSFTRLERLEIRQMKVPYHNLELIPASLLYIRFCSVYVAEGLARLWSRNATEEPALPNLQTVVWDCWSSSLAWKRATVQNITKACARRGVELRILDRPGPYDEVDHDEHEDIEYEAALRASCFSPPQARIRHTRPPIPSRIFSTLASSSSIPRGVFFEPLGTRGTWDTRVALVEQCFSGYSQWAVNLPIGAAVPRIGRIIKGSSRTGMKAAWRILKSKLLG